MSELPKHVDICMPKALSQYSNIHNKLTATVDAASTLIDL
jgi:hypothetical protein